MKHQNRIWLLSRPWLSVAACVVLVAGWVGCESAPRGDRLTAEPIDLTEQLLATGIGPRDVVREGIEPPEALKFLKMDEQAAAKGELTLDEVLAEIAVPEYLSDGLAREVDPDAVTPAKALRAWVDARDAYRQREMTEAKAHLEEAFEIAPEMSGAYLLLGQIEQELGRREQARQAYQEALSLDANDPVARFRLSQLAFATRSHDEVIVLIGQRVDQTDRSVDSGMRYLGEYYLGQALLREGYLRGAVERLAEVLRRGEVFRGQSTLSAPGAAGGQSERGDAVAGGRGRCCGWAASGWRWRTWKRAARRAGWTSAR